MLKKKTIALLTCYMGKLPWYFAYFVQSCKYHPTVDFFIVTDDDSWNGTLPPNVRLIYRSFEEVSQLSSTALGFEVKIGTGYKLCDFKPAYGLIFSSLFKQYDFWGYCDIDVIFGNIRDFMTDQLLENHDLISVRPDWIPGCFMLYKNNHKLNTLFTHSKDYKIVFTSPQHYCFDETNFAHTQFEDGKPYQEINTQIESMMHVVKKMEAQNYIKPFFDLYIIEGGRPGRLKWEDGTLTYRSRFEVLLYHLIMLKKHYKPKTPINPIPGCFNISPNKIYHKKSLKLLSE